MVGRPGIMVLSGGAGWSAQMTDNLVIVQFLHPGGEHQPGPESVMEWNTDQHRRKFIRARGRYVDSHGTAHSETVCFWCEWEPPSRIVARLPSQPASFPRFLHEPLLNRPGAPGRRQNTDPYVFGPVLLYSNCRQFTHTGAAIALQSLAPGSIVLFGSRLDGRFVLDTVLVVESRTPYEVDLNDQEMNVSEAFRIAIIETLRAGTAAQLYRGATYQDHPDGSFSFAPAMPGETAFPRPVIDLPGHITPGLSQNFKATRVSAPQAESLWRQMVDQVHGQGLVLAVHIDEPGIGADDHLTARRQTDTTGACTCGVH
jgi:hypothetical protein